MSLQGSLRVEMARSQESLDPDTGKFYTEYIFRCIWTELGGESQVYTWEVGRRYREFSAVDILLREKYPSRAMLFPYLPGKKFLGSSLSAEFVDKRQRDLGYYITSILQNCPLLVHDEIIDSFLEIKQHLFSQLRHKKFNQVSSRTSM